MEEFGKNLRFYRKQRRQTQTELASMVGVAPAYVSQIESALRMPSLKVARKFAECLNVELPVLLGTPEATRTADHLTDSEKLEVLRGLMLSIEFDQDHRPDRLELERYPGARCVLVSESDERSVRLYTFVEAEPGGAPSCRYSHPGSERLHCAAGRVRVLYGDDEHDLEAGETFEFDSTAPHVLSAEPGTVVVSTASPRVVRPTLSESRDSEVPTSLDEEADGHGAGIVSIARGGDIQA